MKSMRMFSGEIPSPVSMTEIYMKSSSGIGGNVEFTGELQSNSCETPHCEIISIT